MIASIPWVKLDENNGQFTWRWLTWTTAGILRTHRHMEVNSTTV